MVSKKINDGKNVFEQNTSSEKFIDTKDMLSFLNVKNTFNMKLEINKNGTYFDMVFNELFKTLANKNASSSNNLVYNELLITNMNKVIRADSTILHMDEKCVVVSNNDHVFKKTNKTGAIVDGLSCSKIHLLVLPWMPIYNCVQFTEKHADLIKHMRKMGVMCAKGIATKYTNIGPSVSLSNNYTSDKSIETLKKGIEQYNSFFDRRWRILKLSTMKENRNIRQNNFHRFTQFSDERFEKMRNFRSKGKRPTSTPTAYGKGIYHTDDPLVHTSASGSHHVARPGSTKGNATRQKVSHATGGFNPPKTGKPPNSRQPGTSTKSVPGTTPPTDGKSMSRRKPNRRQRGKVLCRVSSAEENPVGLTVNNRRHD